MSVKQGIPVGDRHGGGLGESTGAAEPSVVRQPGGRSGREEPDPSGRVSKQDDAGVGKERAGAGTFCPEGPRYPLARRKAVRFVSILLIVIGVFAVIFVIGDVIERHFFPSLSIPWHHALLTIRAVLAAVATYVIVYLGMRRRERELSGTAEQLTRLLESYKKNAAPIGRFENTHLVHCRDVLDCDRADCLVYNSPGDRCWQVIALSRAAPRDQESQAVDIQQCHECAVYRLSCPDKLTALGESFNNMMFLLEEEADQVGRMRSQMLEKEKMVAIGQMASGIAHEIGNPLSSISSIVQMLKRSPTDTPKTDQLDLIETHIKRISAIVRQLVGLARPGVERWELVDLRQVLEEAVRLVGFDRRARKVEIDFVAPESLPRTYGLGGELQQVFINLSLNALDAMSDGGKLTIHAARKRRTIVVRVQDDGCGIPPEIGQRVFEPFFTTKQPGEGTGLGLAVSYGIVQKHGGIIDFSSKPGEGTEFVVRIPIVDKAPETGHGSTNRTSC